MARLIHINYQPHVVSVGAQGVRLSPETDLTKPAAVPFVLGSMPVLMWSDGKLWDEANLYLSYRASGIVSGSLAIETLHSIAWALRDFAEFLEQRNLRWYEFGSARRDRPTNVYRGFLIDKRTRGEISPSTASGRMAKVINFYRWLISQGIFAPEYPAFTAKQTRIRIEDQFGCERTLSVESSDLHIPNSGSRQRSKLEDGLHPVSAAVKSQILVGAREHCSEEFALMLEIGFCTGMRLQTILDLKLSTLACAVKAETERGRYLRVGPRHDVATKFGVNGEVFIPLTLLEKLRRYASSVRRLKREALASEDEKDLLFLNRFGRRYGRRGEDRAPSINVDMGRLREAMKQAGSDIDGFTFHCTRATFGTQIVVSGMRRSDISMSTILERLRKLLLHKSVATSMRYIKYVEDMEAQVAIEEAFDMWMFGDDDDH